MPTILVIDDDPQIRHVIGDRLKQAGYPIILASNGNDGLSMARQDKPDLILLDMLLPGVGGLEFLKKLRSMSATTDTKVIVMSNLESDNVSEQAKNLAVSDYILKSDISLDNLLRSVKRALRSPSD